MPLPLKNKEGQTIPGKLAFLLPHELLYALVSNSPEGKEPFLETEGLDETNFAHVLQLSAAWQQPLVSLSLWQDAVPYNWDRSESIEVYSWSLPGLSSHAERNMRFPIVVRPAHFATQDTHKAFEDLGLELDLFGRRDLAHSGA